MLHARRWFAPFAAFALLASLASFAGGGMESVPFDSDRWEFVGSGGVVEYMGRKCLAGTATLKDAERHNGVIEVDMAVDGSRSYPGIIFRVRSMEEYERFYVRPHQSGRSDTVQYTPVFNGIAGWQIYNGEGFTNSAEVEADRWIRVRLELAGTQARFYLDGSGEPVLTVHDLKHGDVAGSIGLMAEPPNAVHFSNFAYRIDDALDFGPPPEQPMVPGAFTEWEISRVFDLAGVDTERPFADQRLGDMGWEAVEGEPSGIVDLARFRMRNGRGPDLVFARTTWRTDAPRRGELRFGYSDTVSIFLNGERVFSGSSAYHERDPGFLGIMGLFDAVPVDLKAGANELVLAVAESFGGWGFVCVDGDAVYTHPSLARTWEVRYAWAYPESVVYDPERHVFYASNNFNEGKEFLSKFDANGTILDREWVSGLARPTGLALHDGTLYAVERRSLAAVDPAPGEITGRTALPEARFPNDVAFDAEGNAYVSDSQADTIWRIRDGNAEAWMQGGGLDDPNGLLVLEGALYVGTSGDGCLKAVSLSDRSVATVACLGPGSVVDGLRSDGKGNLLVSDYEGRIFRVTPEGRKTELLNRMSAEIPTADFEFVPETGLLVVPSLYENRITAYTLAE